MATGRETTQREMRRGVATDGLFGVATAGDWFRAGHFESPAEARGAFKLAYQQSLDGMGKSQHDWMGISSEEFDDWMRNDRLPCDVSMPGDERSRVYFLRAGEHVKIGTTTDIEARIRSLQTGCPHRIELLGAILGDTALERALHRKFEHLRFREDGEWFVVTPELLTFIEGVLFADGLRASTPR